MPHSGGGGSHSGGGGGHSSGGGGGSSTRVSSTPFAGSHTYVVYDRTGGSRLVYSDASNYRAETTKSSLIGSLIFALIFVIPGVIAVIFGVIMLLTSFHIGMQKTKIPDNVDDTVYIYDNFDYLTDFEEQELITSLENFRDETGVIPAVELTYDDYWMRNYGSNMETFAYNEYVSRFDDEYHVLIVYSYGYEDSETGFNEFHWHVMWGNDLGKTISGKDETFFGDELQDEFVRANGEDVQEAIVYAVDSLYARLTGKFINLNAENAASGGFACLWGAVFGGSGAIAAVSSIKGYKNSKEKGEVTYRIKGEPKIKTCAYCSCTYYAGTVGTCIHCGAPLEA